VLRAGFAGRKELSPDEETRLGSSLGEVLRTLGHRLAALTPGVPVDAGKEPRVSAFFAQECPLLRLVTGLCEGADALAAQLLETVNVSPDPDANCGPETRCLETELAAVLPFDVETYRRSRPPSFQAEYDRQLARCAWVLVLDGLYDKPDDATLATLPEPEPERAPRKTLADNRCARAYRAQSAFLLRHSDVLIAAANPDDGGKAGGTLETVSAALAFELPVVFIHTGKDGDNVYLIGPDDDLHSVLAEPALVTVVWQNRLRDWVTKLTADPDSGLAPAEQGADDARQHGERLLEEFFDNADNPPPDAFQERIPSRRERVWTWFENHFRSGPGPKSDTALALAPYAAYRERATELNSHYSGLYRGAFLLNYAFAILAVTLAAVSLALLGTAAHSGSGETIVAVTQTAGQAAEPAPTAPTGGWLVPTLLALTVAKLGLVIFILRNTRRANGQKWNDLAVDYRYLAERLRGMFYLPLAGSHQPPAVAPPQFASRVVRQSAVDWLFDALVRAISPADLEAARPAKIPGHDDLDTVLVKKLLTLQPQTTVEKVRDDWIDQQTIYHDRTSRTMQAIHHAAEKTSVRLGWTVIGIVAIDFLIMGGELLHLFPHAWEPVLKVATPFLVCISAVLPAVVAALGGIRFQSECQRLAERSAVMRVLLKGRATAQPGDSRGRYDLADALARRIASARQASDTDPGSWSHDALRLTERIANDFVQEAAEWSVLYAKEVSDPG